MLDKIDLRILSILQGDARASNAAIARKIGMAPSATLERIRKGARHLSLHLKLKPSRVH